MVGTISTGSQTVFINQGLTSSQAQQLISFSKNDHLVKKFTSDKSRFRNTDAYNNWLKKNRIVYSLEDQDTNLVGIIWFGKASNKAATQCDLTFAIRLYPPVRGQGLAENFIRKVFSHFLNSAEYEMLEASGIWLETSADNAAAFSVYKKVGFKQISQPDTNNKVIMTYTKDA